MTRRDRFTASGGGASIQPAAPLSEPYILWDTREWDGVLNTVGSLPNQGTGGSVFDLRVQSGEFGNSPGYRETKANRAGTVSPTWANMGGDPCDAPFTMMVALGTLAARGVSTFAETFLNSVDMFLNFSARAAFSTDPVEMTLGSASPSQAGTWRGPTAKGAAFALVESKLLVMTIDPVDGGATFWRNGVAIRVPFSATLEYFASTVVSQLCQSYSDPPAPTNLFLGLDVRPFGDPLPGVGTRWNGVFGAAYFRGEPTAADIAFWDNYFYAGYVPYVYPVAYEGTGLVRVDATHVYHQVAANETMTPIPGQPLPATYDLVMVGPGGGGAGGTRGGGGGGGQVFTDFGRTAFTTPRSLSGGAQAFGGTVTGGTGTALVFDGASAAAGLGANATTGGTSGGGNAGGTGVSDGGGGGGGDAAAGTNGSAGVGGNGGTATLTDWNPNSATPIGLGGGGAGGGINTTTVGTPGLGAGSAFANASPAQGGGGGGARNSNALVAGGPGGTAGVYIRYLRVD